MLEQIGTIIAIMETIDLTPAAFGNCVTTPKSQVFKLHLPRLRGRIAKDARLDAMMMDAMDGVGVDSLEALPDILSSVDQLRVMQGYYAAKAALRTNA